MSMDFMISQLTDKEITQFKTLLKTIFRRIID